MSEQLEESLERRARIFNTQKYNMYDGPGIRSIAFFKGCPLRCEVVLQSREPASWF